MRPDPRLLLALFLPACAPPGGEGTDSGNAFQAALTVAGEGDLVGTTARGVDSLTSAELLLNEVNFYSCDAPGEAGEVEYEGDYTSDLLAGTDLGTIELDVDSVCGVEVEAERSPTIVIEGTTTNGADFVVISDRNWEWEIEGTVPLQPGDVLNRIQLLFDLDAWLDGVDPDTGVPGGDGVIEISDDANDDLLDLFEDNVSATGRLEGDDED